MRVIMTHIYLGDILVSTKMLYIDPILHNQIVSIDITITYAIAPILTRPLSILPLADHLFTKQLLSCSGRVGFATDHLHALLGPGRGS